jgi:uroporphyrinogen decarboxylase
MKQVVSKLKKEVTKADGTRVSIPSIVFTKGGGLWLEEISGIGCDAVGLDWTMNLGNARAKVGDRVALQGNMDPFVLMAGPEQVKAEALKVLESWGVPQAGTGHVFNLGHGISQFTPPENVAALVDAVHQYSRLQRSQKATKTS